MIAIRSHKLPDPLQIANNGSFFANPIISEDEFSILHNKFPDVVAWNYAGQKKISAGWLIETAGFKDVHDKETGMATWGRQSLILINENAQSTADLISFRDRITKAIHEKYGILLEQEPELL